MAKSKKQTSKNRTSKNSKRKQQSFDVAKLKWPLLGLAIALVAFAVYTWTGGKSMPAVESGSVFSLLPASYTGVDFQNEVHETDERGMHFYDYFYNGAGLAIGDINNDQLPDLFFTGNDVPNRLYINKGDFQFEDISERAGIQSKKWSTGATMVDINQDGLLDIYVCNSGPFFSGNQTTNELYINLGNNQFSEQAQQYGIADPSRSTQASFFDYDKDGDLDLWVMNHALRNRGGSANEWFQRATELSPEEFARECSTLYRNDGNGKFTDISKAAGIQNIGFGLGLSIRDFDGDGWLDVYVANDFFIPDFLFMNNRNGTFTDKSKTKFGHLAYYAMGSDAADFNNDGLTDLVAVDMTPADHVRNKVLMASMDVKGFEYLTEMQDFTPQYMFNSLYVNNGFGVMSNIALFAGVAQTDWSWAPLLADFDNDGLKDLMITNGFRKDTKNNDWQNELKKIREEKGSSYTPADYYDHLEKANVEPVANQIFQNRDGLHFDAKTTEWGFDEPSFSNGAAYADLDLDGDLDLVINNFDQPSFVYRNNSRENSSNQHYIRFKLKDGRSSNAVMHSKVCIHYGEELQCNDYAFTRGYQSFVEPIVHFGLGSREKIDKAVIEWPNGQESVLINPKLDQVHEIDFKALAKNGRSNQKADPLFANITSQYLNPMYKHQENKFDDFAKEVLLPHRQSMLGPALAVGDVNGDGLEDFYVGGAKNQLSALYIQGEDGRFSYVETPAFEDDYEHEDGGALFFDIDQDNDLDLYVASGGGGDVEENIGLLQDRLYLNDGAGNFQKSNGGLPRMPTSTKSIAAADWDGDGDLDLFVGGRTTPGKYPTPPASYLLKNNNGKLVDMSDQLATDFNQLGMVTGAEWLDVDGDNRLDLVVVGEWMPVTVFKNTTDGFENITEELNLQKTAGWYTSLHKGDFDGDGDEDFIAGNVGLNNKYHPSEKKPLYVYANDFDKNGTLDIVLSKIYQGRKVPVRGKECSTTQMPFVSEKFPTYEGFATASLEAIYEEDNLKEAIQYEVYNFASLYLENNGAGQFELRELPTEAQLSPINGAAIKDFDRDGKLDVVLAGNMKQTEVETPKYDSGKGLFMKGNGDGTFNTRLQMDYSGLFLHGDVKDLQLIHIGKDKRPAFLVANNDSNLNLYVYRK